jgi:hypothetical protein
MKFHLNLWLCPFKEIHYCLEVMNWVYNFSNENDVSVYNVTGKKCRQKKGKVQITFAELNVLIICFVEILGLYKPSVYLIWPWYVLFCLFVGFFICLGHIKYHVRPELLNWVWESLLQTKSSPCGLYQELYGCKNFF